MVLCEDYCGVVYCDGGKDCIPFLVCEYLYDDTQTIV